MRRSTRTRGRQIGTAVLLLAIAGCQSVPAADAETAEVLRPLVGSTFDFTDPAAFHIATDGDTPVLELTAAAKYKPPYRSPRAIALLGGLEFRNFVLDAEMQQTGREYGHRDLCLFFGFESPERFYYVHLASMPDPNAHNIMLVDSAARRNLIPPPEEGIDWGVDEWHHVRLVRDVDVGSIKVYFDDMDTPVLETSDSTLTWGRIGFGSFDDIGLFRDIVLTDYESRLGPHGIKPL